VLVTLITNTHAVASPEVVSGTAEVAEGKASSIYNNILTLFPAYLGLNTIIVDGVSLNVDDSNVLASYAVIREGILNLLSGAVAERIWVNEASLNVSQATITSGLEVIDGVSRINGAVISNDRGVGLIASMLVDGGQRGSLVSVEDTIISGGATGVVVGPMSAVSLTNTTVTILPDGEYIKGDEGVRVASGRLEIRNGSNVKGTLRGIKVIDVPESILGLDKQFNSLLIDSSVVDGGLGPAILIDTATIQTEIAVANGSQLISGNGNLFEVIGSGSSILNLNNVNLVGDVIASPESSVRIELKNNASLVGLLSGVKEVAISSGSNWGVRQDNKIESLFMSGGNVNFAGEGFHTLSLGDLSGSGVFDMRINLDTAQGDLLEVNGEATGQHLLNVENTGVEVVPAEFDPLRIVHTEGGDAQFGLIGNRVDLGAYSYLLEQRGNDWFIVGEGKTISPSTQSALALFNAGPAIWNSELTTLRSRMGEVRGQEQGGGWIRSYGNRFNASTGAGLNYQQKQQGLSFGADAPIPVGTGSLVMGLMGGYSKSDLDLSRGTSGSVNSYYIGAYGTWLFEDGYYLDGVLKFNKFRNESNVAMSDGSKAKGRYENAGVGGSVEFGKHIKLADDYFVEPYTQLSGVSIGGDRYSLDNGMTAKSSRTQSILGKVGTTAGRNFTLEDGSVVQPYVRVAMAHEFTRSNDVTVNETRFDNNLFGSRAELGAGVAVSLSKRVQLHADFDYMKGEHVEQPWGANLGLKIAF
jgi:outer membrane autotransporter protein